MMEGEREGREREKEAGSKEGREPVKKPIKSIRDTPAVPLPSPLASPSPSPSWRRSRCEIVGVASRSGWVFQGGMRLLGYAIVSLGG